MTETIEKPEIKLSYYHRKVAEDPTFKEKEKERVDSYIVKRYHQDPEYRQKRLEYQKAYDTKKRAEKKQLRESLKYVAFPCQMCQ